MKEITFTADEALIEEARRANRVNEYDALMEQLRDRFSIDRHYTRDEMNER
jgi:hypothetical protein